MRRTRKVVGASVDHIRLPGGHETHHEVPAGILEEGEEPADCALRELEEETGYSASRITHLATLFPLPGTSAHQMYFFLAEGLTPGRQRLEPAECLTVRTFPLEDLLRSVLAGGATDRGGESGPVRIVDAKTHICILRTAILRGMAPRRGDVA